MLDIENRDGIAIVHMRRQGTNRLDAALLRRIAAAFEFVRGSRAVVLIGTGGTFAVGADAEPPLTGEARAAENTRIAERAALLTVSRHPRPVVAAINGDALDAGFALAAAADVRIMTTGLIGVTPRIVEGGVLSTEAAEIIGRAAGPLTESILTRGATFLAEEAAAMGLVQRTCPSMRLLDEAVARAEALSARGLGVVAHQGQPIEVNRLSAG